MPVHPTWLLRAIGSSDVLLDFAFTFDVGAELSHLLGMFCHRVHVSIQRCCATLSGIGFLGSRRTIR
ncbi:MAG: hypothetical protein ACYDB3_10260 [Acidimicrobiales bacterium]